MLWSETVSRTLLDHCRRLFDTVSRWAGHPHLCQKPCLRFAGGRGRCEQGERPDKGNARPTRPPSRNENRVQGGDRKRCQTESTGFVLVVSSRTAFQWSPVRHVLSSSKTGHQNLHGFAVVHPHSIHITFWVQINMHVCIDCNYRCGRFRQLSERAPGVNSATWATRPGPSWTSSSGASLIPCRRPRQWQFFVSSWRRRPETS